ncbi:urease accessory protein UreF [Rhodococcus sp. IEGM 1330]|uniref:urease accessory protein UreF n=1 Tax=Rhodococcus sp. IEGM 1330 TaxID=3082225 RepID=UPI002954D766|nr:urease accessory UreF family protein [Rhodococcus sp. IEGM 1330]MDV8022367.1 urease accessory UreF family protein [Rhodococcus sp. IEGM 1330]
MTVSEVLMTLRLGDSAFPSGGFAFSSGLEGSYRDGFVTDESGMKEFVREQVIGRWNTVDRRVLRAAWPHGSAEVADRRCEAHSTMSVLREASRRAGAAVLGTFAALGHEDVSDYRRSVLSGAVPGHLPVAQALCFRAAGLSLASAETVSAWQAVSGIAGAGLRLGIVGHLGAQRILADLEPAIAHLLTDRPPADAANLHSFTAFADISAQRRSDGARLFAN